MLPIAKPIKIKVLQHQFSLLMLNLRYIFLLKCFLRPRHSRHSGNAALYLAHGVRRTQRGKTKKKQTKKQDAVGPFFTACFLPCTSRSRGRYSRRLACLRSHVLRAYGNFESKRAISITLFGLSPNKNTFVNINWGCLLQKTLNQRRP